jgi:hypothetical protein
MYHSISISFFEASVPQHDMSLPTPINKSPQQKNLNLLIKVGCFVFVFTCFAYVF